MFLSTSRVFLIQILRVAQIEVEPIRAELCQDHPSLHPGSDQICNAMIPNQVRSQIETKKILNNT